MNAIVKDKDTIYRLRMNKQKRTIKIDVYYLETVTKEVKKTYEYLYMFTLNCDNVDKRDFEYYYNNNATFNDVRMLIRTSGYTTYDFTPYNKFKF